MLSGGSRQDISQGFLTWLRMLPVVARGGGRQDISQGFLTWLRRLPVVARGGGRQDISQDFFSHCKVQETRVNHTVGIGHVFNHPLTI